MIWRLILAIVLLGVVVGGIVGFNLFRDRAIEGYFATMQPPPVTVSVIEAEPITWQPGIEAIGNAHPRMGIANVGSDGKFDSVTSYKLNDGLVPGKHKVVIQGAADRAGA